MTLVKVINRKGARTTVVADAAVMFLPSGDIGKWERDLATRVTIATRKLAPNNSRPHWMHYGKKLSEAGSFTTKTKYDPERKRITTVIGSRVSHAIFPDQGTGIYAGKSPWKAAILPPTSRGGSDLFEDTWRPHKGAKAGPGRMIKGQRGQFFFARGLRAAMISKRIPSIEVADAAVAAKTRGSGVTGLVNSLGLPVDSNGAFRAQLTEWRRWRDEAWSNPERRRTASTRPKRPRYYGVDKTTRARLDREKAKRYRDKMRGGPPRERKPAAEKPTRVKPKPTGATTAGKARFKAAMLKKYGGIEGSVQIRGGYFYITVRTKDERGRTVFKEVRGKVS